MFISVERQSRTTLLFTRVTYCVNAALAWTNLNPPLHFPTPDVGHRVLQGPHAGCVCVCFACVTLDVGRGETDDCSLHQGHGPQHTVSMAVTLHHPQQAAQSLTGCQTGRGDCHGSFCYCRCSLDCFSSLATSHNALTTY